MATWQRSGDELFRDEDFAELYCRDNGRPSVPPSLLATALVLQTYDGVSDDEAKQRADYDLRWKVALGIEVDVRPFAKSTLQEFRAQLIVHDQTRAIFQRSLEVAKRRGVWKKGHAPDERQHIKLALDTTLHPRPWRRAKTRTTCWRMASSRCCAHWPSSVRASCWSWPKSWAARGM